MLSNTNTQTVFRREFLKTVSLGSVALAIPSFNPLSLLDSDTMKKTQSKIGLQLYTVRKDIEKDLVGTLEKVAAIGYAGVETAFFPEDVTYAQAGKVLKEVGLPVFAAHCEIPMGDQKKAMLDMAEAYGCKRMVWHGWPEDSRYGTKDGTKALADIYNEAYHFAKSNGLAFGIHNHWWEFEQQEEGHYPYQILLDEMEEDIFWEIDTYWVKVAGHEPAEIITRLGKRCPMLHIKDGPAKKGEPMVAVGKGVQDFPRIAKASQGHVDWWIVELDECATDMMEAVRESYAYVTQNGLATGKT